MTVESKMSCFGGINVAIPITQPSPIVAFSPTMAVQEENEEEEEEDEGKGKMRKRGRRKSKSKSKSKKAFLPFA
jgi:hypothetical protein